MVPWLLAYKQLAFLVARLNKIQIHSNDTSLVTSLFLSKYYTTKIELSAILICSLIPAATYLPFMSMKLSTFSHILFLLTTTSRPHEQKKIEK